MNVAVQEKYQVLVHQAPFAVVVASLLETLSIYGCDDLIEFPVDTLLKRAGYRRRSRGIMSSGVD